ncbi:MAG: hypothetical protein ABI670_18910 [Chloroflexota bacterium]
MQRNIRSTVLVGFGFLLGVFAPLAWGTLATQAQTQANCLNFPETGFSVCGKFKDYWQQHGGLAQQGFPISGEFIETSALNGRPYTVQYFERAVFELHPENQPPNDVLLSQLGTYLGKANYVPGFPSTPGATPFYENRNDPVGTLKSFYNAITRKEYERAYSYFNGAPNPLPDLAPPYNQFVQGYADTTLVTLAVGKVTVGAGAGNLFANFSAVVTATHTDGSTHTFAGCYVMHRVNDGISPNPDDVLWHIYSANLSEVPANSSLDTLLAQPCNP